MALAFAGTIVGIGGVEGLIAARMYPKGQLSVIAPTNQVSGSEPCILSHSAL